MFCDYFFTYYVHTFFFKKFKVVLYKCNSKTKKPKVSSTCWLSWTLTEVQWGGDLLGTELEAGALPSLDLYSKLIKKQRHHFADKGLYSQNYGSSSSYVQMWELDYKEGWALKNWCFWIVVLDKTLESPLDCKEIQPVNPKGNPEYLLEGLILKPKLQYFGHLIWRADSLEDPDAGKDWRQEEKGTAEDEMVG